MSQFVNTPSLTAQTSLSQRALKPLAFISLLLTAGIFGFFYAWVCSTMWGLDAIDPRVAIQAMNGMNGSVRNMVFAPAFFGTPLALLVTAAVAQSAGQKTAAALFLSAGALYIVGAFFVTMQVNVPMNEALMLVDIPQDKAAAQAIWTAYSETWQIFNIARTCVSGVCVMLVGAALWTLR